jgi:verruculogen synthase
MTGQCERVKRIDLRTSPDQAVCFLKEDGVLILKEFLPLDIVQAFQDEIKQDMRKAQAGARYEEYKDIGTKTTHLTNLTMRSEIFRSHILNHSWMHAVCERIFGPFYGDYWINGAAIAQLEPGEKAQTLHRDDAIYPVSEFRGPEDPQLNINFLVALTDFRDDNGATRIIPGSHLWDVTRPAPSPEQSIPAVMQPGDVVVYFGSLIHGAGENRSLEPRRALGISIHPCQFTPAMSHLHVPRAIIETMTPRAQKMVGWRTLRSRYPLWLGGDEILEETLGLVSKEE